MSHTVLNIPLLCYLQVDELGRYIAYLVLLGKCFMTYAEQLFDVGFQYIKAILSLSLNNVLLAYNIVWRIVSFFCR